MGSKYDWNDIYPELVNKIRWAICTSFKTRESNYPYGAGQSLATVLSQYAIDLVKAESSEPGLTGSTAAIRRFLEPTERSEEPAVTTVEEEGVDLPVNPR